jgi:predicted enzyme related to lactoylglutathione lyase
MGNSFVHMELSTDDVAAAKKFYKKVFEWKLNDLGPEMGNYTLIDTGSKSVGGGMAKKMMPGQPTAWLVYAEVDSVKKTIAKAEKAGAKAIVPFQEIGEMGAIGIFVDPTGAAFGVWEKAKKAPKTAKKASKKPAKKKR